MTRSNLIAGGAGRRDIWPNAVMWVATVAAVLAFVREGSAQSESRPEVGWTVTVRDSDSIDPIPVMWSSGPSRILGYRVYGEKPGIPLELLLFNNSDAKVSIDTAPIAEKLDVRARQNGEDIQRRCVH